MHRRAGVLIAVVLTLVACGDDDDTPQAATTPQTTAVATAVATTEPAATTAPPTAPPTTASTAPSTAAPATSAAPPTTASVATGWVESNFIPGASYQGYSGNWQGDAGPSPAAPADGDTPADGYYVATVIEPWSPAEPDHLSVRIQRLEWCSALPDGCEYTEESVDEMNVDPSWHLDVDVPLDETTSVVVQGFLCWDAPEQKQATGVELADLFGAYTTDYQTYIEPKLGSPTAGYDVAVEIASAPVGGFVGEESVCPGGMAGPLRYVHAEAPVLLLQTVTDFDGESLDATDLVRLNGVQFTDGVALFYFYAGFYS